MFYAVTISNIARIIRVIAAFEILTIKNANPNLDLFLNAIMLRISAGIIKAKWITAGNENNIKPKAWSASSFMASKSLNRKVPMDMQIRKKTKETIVKPADNDKYKSILFFSII